MSVSCTCGATCVGVPCGGERTTKPPRCTKLCQLPSTCHHSNPHHCHAGKCPPCKQICSLPLVCGHSCGTRCHSQPTPLVPVSSITYSKYIDQNYFTQTKTVAPWKKVEPTLVVKPCPPCQRPVLRACYGGHQKREMSCCEDIGYSCGQLCGRTLQCTNHICKRICHRIINAPGQNLVSCVDS